MALHDLFTIAVEQHRVNEAEQYAREAYQAYDPRIPRLAHDVASFWMHQGFFDRALVVFEAVLPLIARPAERLLVLSMIARAAGGANAIKTFTIAWIGAWRIIDRNSATDRACAAVRNLAFGAAALADWERAELAARFALDLSRGRGETEVAVQAQSILYASRERAFTLPLIESPDDPEILEAADALASGLVRRLAACAGSASSDHSPRMLW